MKKFLTVLIVLVSSYLFGFGNVGEFTVYHESDAPRSFTIKEGYFHEKGGSIPAYIVTTTMLVPFSEGDSQSDIDYWLQLFGGEDALRIYDLRAKSKFEELGLNVTSYSKHSRSIKLKNGYYIIYILLIYK